MSMTERWVRVAASEDIPAGHAIPVEIAGLSVAVCHLEDGGWYAIENVCSHAYALLTDGWLDGAEIECPLHAGRFDVRTGRATCLPADADIKTYGLRLDGTDVLLELPE